MSKNYGGMQEAPKDFTNIGQQIEKLKKCNLICSEEDVIFAEGVLKEVKYYSLIDGCGKVFLSGWGRRSYTEGATLRHLYDCYKFDCKLKKAVLFGLQQVEQKINTLTMHYFGKKYHKGDNIEFYRDPKYYFQGDIFDNPGEEFVSRLNAVLRNPERIEFLGYMKEYENAPIWILANSFSFGLTAGFYDALERDIQKQICAEIGMFSTTELSAVLCVLNLYRNICAHNYAPLFDGDQVNITVSEKSIKHSHLVKWVAEENGGRWDFYALMMILAQLLNFEEWSGLEQEVTELLAKVEKDLKIVPQAYKELEKQLGLAGKAGKWGKKILYSVGIRIKNTYIKECAQNWYKDTLIDTAQSLNEPAGRIIEERLLRLQEKIIRWNTCKQKTRDYNTQIKSQDNKKNQKKKKR